MQGHAATVAPTKNGCPRATSYATSRVKEVWPAQVCADAAANKRSVIATHKRKNGSTYSVQVHMQRTVFNNKPALVAFVLDISEQQTTLHQLSSVIKGAALGYWDWNYQTGEFVVNDRFLEIIGESRADVTNQSGAWQDKIHPDDQERCGKVVRDCMIFDKPYVFEFRMLHREGHWVWVRGSGAVVARDLLTKRVLRLCGTIIDISKQKQNELEREQFFTFFHLAKDMMVIADPNGCFRKVNPAASEYSVIRHNHNHSYLNFVHPDDRIHHGEPAARTVGYSWPSKIVMSDGRQCALDILACEFRLRAGVGYGTVVMSTPQTVVAIFQERKTYRPSLELA